VYGPAGCVRYTCDSGRSIRVNGGHQQSVTLGRRYGLVKVVGRDGIEPSTFRFQAQCEFHVAFTSVMSQERR
jgi:hypothetical protein